MDHGGRFPPDLDTTVLAAPVPTKGGKRVVVFLDGSVRPLPEAEFHRRTSGRTASGP